ncbi:MAG: amino acid adenylation domain-containing protein, partial [Deltaproteobacteria bacterium]|nr:amino acid adenylation domain-containing protein [Deltaproteobacteria bacterium]
MIANSNSPIQIPAKQRAKPCGSLRADDGGLKSRAEEVERSIAARFETIVRMYPDRLAVKTGNRSLSYAELNQYADGIAHALVACRGGGNEPIALLLEHGIDAVAAIMGILKAGKAYVVLSESFPKERNLYIAADCETPLIITNHRQKSLAAELAAPHRTLLSLDDIRHDTGEVTRIDVQPDSCASILYTSGSTGQPKGVVSTHRNILTSLRQHSHRLDIMPDDRLTLLHSLSFGSALSHFFPSLLNGASLYPFDVKTEGVARLASWLIEEELTMFHSPPALFRQLAESLSQDERPRSLRFLRLSGAPITPIDFELYKKHFEPATKLILGMGSSEARGICSAVVDHSFEFPKDGSPVGYPEPGKKIILLDENGYEVALGDVGEIAVKSTNINQGYWRAPHQTAAKFSPDLDGGEERLYLTGDLG